MLRFEEFQKEARYYESCKTIQSEGEYWDLLFNLARSGKGSLCAFMLRYVDVVDLVEKGVLVKADVKHFCDLYMRSAEKVIQNFLTKIQLCKSAEEDEEKVKEIVKFAKVLSKLGGKVEAIWLSEEFKVLEGFEPNGYNDYKLWAVAEIKRVDRLNIKEDRFPDELPPMPTSRFAWIDGKAYWYVEVPRDARLDFRHMFLVRGYRPRRVERFKFALQDGMVVVITDGALKKLKIKDINKILSLPKGEKQVDAGTFADSKEE